MATSIGGNIVRDGYRYREFEQGVQRWEYYQTDTGDATGGTCKFEIYTSPGAQDSFQEFVAITSVRIRTTTAAAVGGFIVTPTVAQWERYGNYGKFPVCAGKFEQATSATAFTSQWYGFVNCGRILKGTQGELELEIQNVDTLVANVFVEGLVSEKPIAGRWWLSA